MLALRLAGQTGCVQYQHTVTATTIEIAIVVYSRSGTGGRGGQSITAAATGGAAGVVV